VSIASREGQAPLSDARIKSAQGGAQRELSPRVLHVQGNRGTSRANVAHSTLVVEAVNHLNVRSCLIDGEVVCCDEKGVTSFQLLPFLYAFDLLELNGTDLRRERCAQGDAGQRSTAEPGRTPERATWSTTAG
jgi:hypothetical protein